VVPYHTILQGSCFLLHLDCTIAEVFLTSIVHLNFNPGDEPTVLVVLVFTHFFRDTEQCSKESNSKNEEEEKKKSSSHFASLSETMVW
jgi:hypothetical protein